MDGFGATTQPLVYGTRDDLTPSQRQRAVDAVYNQVRLTLGTTPTLLESPGGFDARANSNADPQTINWSGFDSTLTRAAKEKVFDLAQPYGYDGYSLGNSINTRWASPWLAKIRTSNYELYLDYAARQVLANQLFWRDTYGIVPRYYMLFNEPLTGNGELAGATSRDIVDIVKRAGATLRAAGFADVKFIIPSEETEEASLRVALDVLQDPDARPYVGVIAYHTYPYGSVYSSVPKILATSGAGNPDPSRIAIRGHIRDAAAQYGVAVWMTEVSHGEVDARSYDGFRGRAIHIHDELSYANASAYFGMLSMWDLTSQKEHFNGDTNLLAEDSSIALIDNSSDTVSITGMGRAIGHYARWVPPGAVRVEGVSTDPLLLASAFRDAASGRMIVVIINNHAAACAVVVQMSGAAAGGDVSGEQSTPAAYWQALPTFTPTDPSRLDFVVPGLSVTTMAIPLAP